MPISTIPEKRVQLIVDLAALEKNFYNVRKLAQHCRIIAVLKANAYGLGARPIAKVLKNAGIDGFAVATLYEANELLDLGLPVRILGNLLPEEIAPAIERNLICPVTDLEMAKRINAEAARQNRKIRIQIAIDSGMGRLGIQDDDAVEEIERIAALPQLQLSGLYSHCPVASDRLDRFTSLQSEKLRLLLTALGKKQIFFDEIHMAASDALNYFPETISPPFNGVRIGFNLYGYYSNDQQKKLGFQPVLSLKTKLVAVRTLPAEHSIGYGRTCVLSAPTRVGTIAAGYADGLPLALSNTGYVLIRGKRCPILGRLSMDYTTINLDAVPDAQWGDEVICLGQSGEEEITLDDWAAIKKTHPYDILCAFGSRCDRLFREKDGSLHP